MLQYIKNINSESTYGLWEIEETHEELVKGFNQIELQSISSHHPKKQLEYLSTRHLLKSIVQELGFQYNGVRKDQHGKPFLIESRHHISISHSFPYVTCLFNKSKPCGIDIEKPKDQINRIKHKFLSDKELVLTNNDIQLQCLFWSAKEALYKLYGRKNLLFIENIKVEFSTDDLLTGAIMLNDNITEYTLKFEKFNGYIIVYNI